MGISLMIPDDSSIHIAVVGDFLIHDRCIEAALDERNGKYDFNPFFLPIKDIISAADIGICNLETTISGREYGYTGYPNFNAPEEILTALEYCGFNVVCTANNHAADHEEQGILNTLKALRKYQFNICGTSDTSSLSHRNVIIEKKSFKIGINAYTYGINEHPIPTSKPWLVNRLDFDLMKKDIDFMRSNNCELVIICLHAGEEYRLMPDNDQLEYVKRLQDFGVDIILGNHPHVVQPAILNHKKNQYTIYSLGNFYSNQRDDYRDAGLIVDLEIQRKQKTFLFKVNYIPTYVHRWSQNGKFMYRVVPLDNIERYSTLPEFPLQKAEQLKNHILSHLEAVL
jgi:poly-gamma-glutamate synthesis protein (capsule biosynthesis protein)